MDNIQVRKNTSEFVYGVWSLETQIAESFMTSTRTNDETGLDIADQMPIYNHSCFLIEIIQLEARHEATILEFPVKSLGNNMEIILKL